MSPHSSIALYRDIPKPDDGGEHVDVLSIGENIDEEGRIILYFDYNENAKDALKAKLGYPQCKWDPEANPKPGWSISNDHETITCAADALEAFEIDVTNLRTLIVDSDSDQDTEEKSDGIVADLFIIEDEGIRSPISYYLNPPDGDDYRERYRLMRKINSKYPQTLMALSGARLIVHGPLPFVEDGKTIRIIGAPKGEERHRAIEALLLESLKREAGDEEYENLFGRIFTREPVASCRGYELHRQFRMRIRTFGSTKVLQ